MLRNINDYMECTLEATDGLVGKVSDAYFDEEAWVVRYLAVDTASLPKKRCILMPAKVAGTPRWLEHVLPVSLSREQIASAPEMHSPVSRQHAFDCLEYFAELGFADSTLKHRRSRTLELANEGAGGSHFHDEEDPHLHSVHDLVSYHLCAIDGDIGQVSGLLIDPMSWAIRFMIVRTSHWWVGHDILISPEWIDEVLWGEASVVVALTRAAVRSSPPFDEAGKVYDLDGERSYEHHDLTGQGSVAERRE
jgi:hypothetical protein